MNKIIALQGKSNTGKTTTLSALIKKIDKNYNIQLLKNRTDKIAIVNINGKRLGITTAGDNRKTLDNCFDLMGKCDLYVCACRLKGETVNFLESKAKCQKVIFHGKWYIINDFISDREKANNAQAKLIYDEIINILS